MFACILVMASCGQNKKAEATDGVYGEDFSYVNLLTPEQLLIEMDGNDSLDVMVTGVISGVCKHEGCWITLTTKDGDDIYINTKDKAYSLPTSVLGKTAIINGTALSVEVQKAIEIASGTDPDELDWIDNVSVEATGIIVE